MKGKYDWNALKTEFVTSDISASALAKKHNISPATLYRHYQIERWNDARREYLGSVVEKCADKAAYIAAIKLAKELDIANKLSDVLENAADDNEQFYRYIVKEKDADGSVTSEEKTFRKMDMKSLNDAIKALQSLGEIKSAVYGIVPAAQERKLRLEEARLENDSSETDSGTGVVMLPEVEINKNMKGDKGL